MNSEESESDYRNTFNLGGSHEEGSNEDLFTYGPDTSIDYGFLRKLP